MRSQVLTVPMISERGKEELYAIQLVLVSMVVCVAEMVYRYPICLSRLVDNRQRPVIRLPYVCSKTC